MGFIKDSIHLIIDGQQFILQILESDLPIVLEEWEDNSSSNSSDDSGSVKKSVSIKGCREDLITAETVEVLPARVGSAVSSLVFHLQSTSHQNFDGAAVGKTDNSNASSASPDSSFSDSYISNMNVMISATTDKIKKEIEARNTWQGGLSFARKKRFIRSLVSSNNISLLGLIETKKEVFDDFSIRFLGPHLDFDYCFVPSTATSGGLLCVWNSKSISLMRIVKTNRWITLDFISSGLIVRFILVYASNCPRERALMWADILPEFSLDFIFILVGNFNEILHPSERFNCTEFSSSMLEFSDFISNSNLIKASLQALPRSYSDHVPILFSSELKTDWGPKPFKSINAWWSHKEFNSFVENSWISITLRQPSANLVFKLKEFRKLLKAWNRDIFGNIDTRLADVQAAIVDMETGSDFHSLSLADGTRLANLRIEFNQIPKHLKSLWHQNSRLSWNLNGNTKYFHTVASMHSKSNLISEFLIGGVLYSSPANIKQMVHSYYKSLFKRTFSIRFSFDSLPIKSLSDLQAASISIPFSEEDIFSTLMSCDDNKAPGPDGFNYCFYKKAWKTLKNDFIGLFGDFYNSAAFPIGINTTFIVLIPKFQGAMDIEGFRQISLINGVFKLISKALANRLSPVLPLVIS
ncbi:uncharacterized protein LOC126677172 [Mercurialis annua]|uniref:uncharacterized protein LOC126677172 n=1 Tax=Mercurialis annua TaxID=3986 RepID=UPI002160E3F2|nr:uncharacterized protein LOC126677172 [Mercurialis annua]